MPKRGRQVGRIKMHGLWGTYRVLVRKPLEKGPLTKTWKWTGKCTVHVQKTGYRVERVMEVAHDLPSGGLHSYPYTGCPRRNVKYFGRVILMLNYTDITQNTHIRSWTVTEIMAREKCGHLVFPRSIRLQLYREPPLPVVIWLLAERTLASFTAHELRQTR